MCGRPNGLPILSYVEYYELDSLISRYRRPSRYRSRSCPTGQASRGECSAPQYPRKMTLLMSATLAVTCKRSAQLSLPSPLSVSPRLNLPSHDLTDHSYHTRLHARLLPGVQGCISNQVWAPLPQYVRARACIYCRRQPSHPYTAVPTADVGRMVHDPHWTRVVHDSEDAGQHRSCGRIQRHSGRGHRVSIAIGHSQ